MLLTWYKACSSCTQQLSKHPSNCSFAEEKLRIRAISSSFDTSERNYYLRLKEVYGCNCAEAEHRPNFETLCFLVLTTTVNMSDSVSDDALRESLRNRRKYIQQNLECVTSILRKFLIFTPMFAHIHVTICYRLKPVCECSNLTMKACRKLLEEDLGLPEKSLANRKEFIQKYIDKVNPGGNRCIIPVHCYNTVILDLWFLLSVCL